MSQLDLTSLGSGIGKMQIEAIKISRLNNIRICKNSRGIIHERCCKHCSSAVQSEISKLVMGYKNVDVHKNL